MLAGLLALIGLGFALGLRHGIDWDHIAAITDITSSILTTEEAEGRLVALLACVPQTLTLYELLPFALIAPSWQVSAALVLLTNALYLWIVYVIQPSTEMALSDFSSLIWPPALVLGYLPAVIVVVWPVLKRWRKREVV